MLVGALSVLAAFVILVGVHEAGHFAAARLSRLPVLEFAVGMGPRLWSWTRGGTVYSLRALPIGGFVRLLGMEPGQHRDPRGFHHLPTLKQVFILFAGPLANLLLAGVIATGINLTRVNDDPGLVYSVRVGGPAYAAGLRPNDHIQSLDGQPVRSIDQVVGLINADPRRPVELVYRRGSAVRAVSVQPQYDPQLNRYVIGFSAAPVLSPAAAVGQGVSFPVVALAELSTGLVQLSTGQIPGGLLGPQGATGTIGMATIVAQSAAYGFVTWAYVLALLSIGLALANLLPIPALDGGRIVVSLLEWIRRKPFDREREMAVQRAGLAFVLALAAFMAVLDIQRLASHEFPGLR